MKQMQNDVKVTGDYHDKERYEKRQNITSSENTDICIGNNDYHAFMLLRY